MGFPEREESRAREQSGKKNRGNCYGSHQRRRATRITNVRGNDAGKRSTSTDVAGGCEKIENGRTSANRSKLYEAGEPPQVASDTCRKKARQSRAQLGSREAGEEKRTDRETAGTSPGKTYQLAIRKSGWGGDPSVRSRECSHQKRKLRRTSSTAISHGVP